MSVLFHTSALSWQNWWHYSDNQLESNITYHAFASHKSLVFTKGPIFKNIDMFWVETFTLPNTLKLQLWKHRTFSKGEWIFSSSTEKMNVPDDILYICTYIHIQIYHCANSSLTMEFCLNLYINLSEQNVRNGHKSVVPDFGHFQFLYAYKKYKICMKTFLQSVCGSTGINRKLIR